jgi:hypothetical protein
MSVARQFVCGFYGARDGYEVPVALQEAGQLEVLLTDFYGRDGLLAKSGITRAVRQHEGLQADKVRGSLALTLAKRMCGKILARCFALAPDRARGGAKEYPYFHL